MAVGDRFSDLATAATDAAANLQQAAEDAKRAGLTSLVDLGIRAQTALDEMPAEDDGEDDEGPPVATQLPS
jgi:aminoglycoside phosphotransferase